MLIYINNHSKKLTKEEFSDGLFDDNNKYQATNPYNLVNVLKPIPVGDSADFVVAYNENPSNANEIDNWILSNSDYSDIFNGQDLGSKQINDIMDCDIVEDIDLNMTELVDEITCLKGRSGDNTESLNAALNFKQDIRHKFLIDWVYQIPLTEVRKDWKLKSTYFSIYDNGEYLSFKGKGFGHGVGLSQEGAMRMIELGFDFLEVLRFYYTDVHLINIKMKEFYTID